MSILMMLIQMASFSEKNVHLLTLISPPSFLLNCNIINIHEHNLHMIIVFVFLLINKALTFLFAIISDLP